MHGAKCRVEGGGWRVGVFVGCGLVAMAHLEAADLDFVVDDLVVEVL